LADLTLFNINRRQINQAAAEAESGAALKSIIRVGLRCGPDLVVLTAWSDVGFVRRSIWRGQRDSGVGGGGGA
jgi:hypothetical protein